MTKPRWQHQLHLYNRPSSAPEDSFNLQIQLVLLILLCTKGGSFKMDPVPLSMILKAPLYCVLNFPIMKLHLPSEWLVAGTVIGGVDR